MFRRIRIAICVLVLGVAGCEDAETKHTRRLVAELNKTVAFIEVGMAFDEYRACIQRIDAELNAVQNTATAKASLGHFIKCAAYLSAADDVWQSYEDRLRDNAKVGVREDLTTSAMRRERGELWAEAAAELRAGVVKMEGGS